MPNIKSAKKRVDVIAKKSLENKMIVSKMKTALKKYNAALAAEDFARANELLPQTVSIIDSACSDGILHMNNAARKKAQLSVNMQKAIKASEEKKAIEAANAAAAAAKAPVVEAAPVVEEKPAKKAKAKKVEVAVAEEKPVKKATKKAAKKDAE